MYKTSKVLIVAILLLSFFKPLKAQSLSTNELIATLHGVQVLYPMEFTEFNPYSPIAYRRYGGWSGGNRKEAYGARFVRTAE